MFPTRFSEEIIFFRSWMIYCLFVASIHVSTQLSKVLLNKVGNICLPISFSVSQVLPLLMMLTVTVVKEDYEKGIFSENIHECAKSEAL